MSEMTLWARMIREENETKVQSLSRKQFIWATFKFSSIIVTRQFPLPPKKYRNGKCWLKVAKQNTTKAQKWNQMRLTDSQGDGILNRNLLVTKSLGIFKNTVKNPVWNSSLPFSYAYNDLIILTWKPESWCLSLNLSLQQHLLLWSMVIWGMNIIFKIRTMKCWQRICPPWWDHQFLHCQALVILPDARQPGSFQEAV